VPGPGQEVEDDLGVAVVPDLPAVARGQAAEQREQRRGAPPPREMNSTAVPCARSARATEKSRSTSAPDSAAVGSSIGRATAAGDP
jgi:hypothetical protein